jgi:hypothetical protein
VLHLVWTYIVGLLFVNLYFYIFNQQRFRAGRAMNSSPASKPCPLPAIFYRPCRSDKGKFVTNW